VHVFARNHTLLGSVVATLLFPWPATAAGDDTNGCDSDTAVFHLLSPGPAWDGWPELCARLNAYVGTPPNSLADGWPAEVERKLMATGYFEEVSCSHPSKVLECHTSPRGIVRGVKVTGDVPFPLLASALERRLMLRPGALLAPGLVERQVDRLKQHLQSEGIFGVEVVTELEPAGAAGPNRGFEIVVRLVGGKKYSLGEVEVRGDAVVPAKDVDGRLRHSWIPWLVSERFSPTQLRQDIDELADWLRQHGWPEARVRSSYTLDGERGVAKVSVAIDSGPKVSMTFVGNRVLDADDLRAAAAFADSGAVDTVEVDDTAARIAHLYQQDGYYAVTVTSSQEQIPDGLTIVYEIAEGERATIGEITFRGNRQLGLADLQELYLRTRTEGLLRRGRWVDVWVDEDCATIRELYRREGFASATVSAEKVVIGPGILSVSFRIQEGESDRVVAMSAEGTPEGLSLEPEDQLTLVAGAPFEERLLARDQQKLLVGLAQEGYVEAQAEATVSAAEDGSGKVIHWHVEPGERAILGGVLTRGNVRTSGTFLARDLELEDGEPVQLETLSTGRRRLRGLGIFHGVELEPLPTRDPANTWLMVAVQEREVRSLDAALSFSTDDLFAVGLDYSDHNWWGQAISLDLKARVANASEVLPAVLRIGNADRISLAVRAPHPLGAPFDVSTSARISMEERRLFVEQLAVAGFSLSRQLLTRESCGSCPDVVLSLGYEVSVTRLREKQSALDTLAGTPFERSFKIAPSLSIARTDSSISPERGYRCSTQLELAHPLLGGGLDARTYWRVTALAAGFVPLFTPFSFATDGGTRIGGPLFLMAGVRYGAAQPFGADRHLPETEAFYYGGDLSVRGMEARASAVAVSEGRYLMTTSTELHWRVLPDTWLGALEVGGFVDAGTVAHGFGKLFDEVAVSSGPTLRFVTLVGPLAVSYAWPVVRPAHIVARDPRAMPANGRLHITFGAAY